MHEVKKLLKLLKSWNHDIMAASFAVLSMVLLLQLLSAGSAPVTAETPATASPASLGVSPETVDAPDHLARAGKASERNVPEPVLANDERKQHAEAPSEERRQDSSDANPPDNSPMDSEAVPQPNEVTQTSRTAPDNGEKSPEAASEQLAVADLPPKPNEVEEKPKPVEEMSAEDIQKAVEAYEEWVHQGDIRLILEWALSPEQLNSIAALFVVGTASTTLGILPDGVVDDITFQGIPAGKLIGDLPPDRNKWPSVAVKRARERLGPSYAARNANFLLTDACVLPEQHESLAKLLDVDLAEAQRLVRETAKEVSQEELDALIQESQRPHEFGVLPPDLGGKENRR